MSWSGTVTCSNCYSQGHNKRKCPRLTAQFKEIWERQSKAAERYRAMTDEECVKEGCNDRKWNIQYHDQRAQQARDEYLKRTKIDLATGKKVTNKAAKAERMKKVTCGYCKHSGHTRRVCQNAKNDYALYSAQTRQVRQEWLDKFTATGVGVGSMVIANARGYNDAGEWGTHRVIGLVTSVNYEQIDAHTTDPSVIVVKTNAQMKGANDSYRNTHISPLRLTDCQESERHTVLPSGAIPQPGADWVDSIKPIKEVFDTKEDRRWDYKWNDESWVVEQRAALDIPIDTYAVQS